MKRSHLWWNITQPICKSRKNGSFVSGKKLLVISFEIITEILIQVLWKVRRNHFLVGTLNSD